MRIILLLVLPMWWKHSLKCIMLLLLLLHAIKSLLLQGNKGTHSLRVHWWIIGHLLLRCRREAAVVVHWCALVMSASRLKLVLLLRHESPRQQPAMSYCLLFGCLWSTPRKLQPQTLYYQFIWQLLSSFFGPFSCWLG